MPGKLSAPKRKALKHTVLAQAAIKFAESSLKKPSEQPKIIIEDSTTPDKVKRLIPIKEPRIKIFWMDRKRARIQIPINDGERFKYYNTPLCCTPNCRVFYDPNEPSGCSKIDLDYLRKLGVNLDDFNRGEEIFPYCKYT